MIGPLNAMRHRKTELAFFLAGLAIFIYLVSRFGIGQIMPGIAQSGWSLLLASLVWLVIYVLNTLSWKLLLDHEGRDLSFLRLFLINISGFAIDTITPVVALGGEPYKVKALSANIGTHKSVSAVLLFRMVHTLGHMLMLLAGTLASMLFLPLPPTLFWTMAGAGVVIVCIIALIVSGLRAGVFRRLQLIVGKIRLPHRIPDALNAHEAEFHEMDRVVTHVYHNRRGTFLLAVFVEFVSRALMGVEIYVILRSSALDISLVSAIFLYVAYSIIINVVFFVPLNLGVREGGLYLGLQSLAMAPSAGIYLGVMIRIREFIWILIGLLTILPLARRTPKVVAVAEEPPSDSTQ